VTNCQKLVWFWAVIYLQKIKTKIAPNSFKNNKDYEQDCWYHGTVNSHIAVL